MQLCSVSGKQFFGDVWGNGRHRDQRWGEPLLAEVLLLRRLSFIHLAAAICLIVLYVIVAFTLKLPFILVVIIDQIRLYVHIEVLMRRLRQSLSRR